MAKFSVGDCVTVVESCTKYKGDCSGKVGSIKRVYVSMKSTKIIYEVKIHGFSNPYSKSGCFWFEDHHLKRTCSFTKINIESEEIPMFENYVVAKIQFLDDPVPVYSYALYEDIAPGTVVVVQTGSHGFALAKIESVDSNPEAKKNVHKGRQVVCPVDFSAYNARKEALRRAEELKKEMDALLREQQAMAIYEMFAEKNPILKTMLDEFKSLNSKIKGETNVK